MKKIIYLALTLLLVSRLAQAQAPAQCPTPQLGNMPQNFADWRWDLTPSDPNYCRMWIVNRDEGLSKLDAPWVTQSTPILAEIGSSRDYLPSNGWVLIKRDLGARTAIATPYFILYNKYTGLMRGFFYVNNRNGTYTSGVVVSLNNVNVGGSRGCGVMSLANGLVPAADKYLPTSPSSDETMVYVPKWSGQSSWVMAEFTMGFDPNSRNTAFNGGRMAFAVQGLVDNKVNLAGSMNWKTERNDGYGYGGKTAGTSTDDNVANVRKFLATGNKISGKVAGVDVSKITNSIKTGAELLQSHVPAWQTNPNLAVIGHSGIYNVLDGIIGASSSGGSLGNILKTVTGIAKAAGPTFALVGSVVGFLWPAADGSAEAPAFTPTISTGSISLSGTITTKFPLDTYTIQVPGTNHDQNSPFTQPYYDCVLGIFNLKNTPLLDVITHYENTYGSSGPALNVYKSYRVSNDLVAAYNAAAGLKLVSVEAALGAEGPALPSGLLRRCQIYHRWPMVRQILAGTTEIVQEGTEKTVYQTPFVSLGAFKNMSLTTVDGDKIFVRVKAVLQRTDDPNGPPIFFVQDYAVDTNANATPTNPRYTGNQNSPETPFTNFASAIADGTSYQPFGTPPPAPVSSMYDEEFMYDSNAGYLPYYYLRPGNYVSPSINTFGSSLTFPNPSAPAGSTAVFNHPRDVSSTYLMALGFVALKPGFSVTEGTNLVISTSLLEARNNQNKSPDRIEATTTPCPYNTVSYARGVLAATEPATKTQVAIEVAPNPTTDVVFVTTTTTYQEAAIVVINVLGQEVKRIGNIPVGKHTTKIDLRGKIPGMYIVRLLTGSESVSQKVLLQ